ncbi:MarR family winged helix-turn-helix transcriptional regulator [Actinacidiphila oryziradicis]|uniref:MarR family transcriptional regulator n=1 Tax=Actinacidiphila oryziradicis TaxID=2571141 RepID=A0A4U0RN47_9ACTN|nr:MarR family transcriptional regulator [Actinacidiphila oryziradicis]TJZ96552.1 MarR family transcriptional regulator [Actinacidiphila oryziradicis]
MGDVVNRSPIKGRSEGAGAGGVTTVLKRLEKAGLIEREQDTTDGRSSWVRLTNTGIETAGATMQAWSEAESNFFQAVPPEVLQAASDTLHEVLLAIGDGCSSLAGTLRAGSLLMWLRVVGPARNVGA